MLIWKGKCELLIVFHDKETLIEKNLTIELSLEDISHFREILVLYIYHTTGTESLEGLTYW